MEQLRLGARAASRPVSEIDIAAYLPAAVGPESERLLRQQLAHYIGGMGTYYHEFVARLGFASDADRIHQLWQQGERIAAVEAVSDDLLEQCTLGTDAVAARARLESYRREGVGLPVVAPAHGSTPADVMRTLEALAPRL